MFDGIRDRMAGSLWVSPSLAAGLAVLLGSALSFVRPGPDSVWYDCVFQGSASDARDLLAIISTTVVTVIALMLGLTVVALQMSSTQFSPRLLRSFLRDRPTQVALSVFVATFTYATAGLFTVGVGIEHAPDDYPRLAVSAALLWLFLSLAMVVYFADHVAHAIQIDAIMRRAEHDVLQTMRQEPTHGFDADLPTVPDRHCEIRFERSGYIQALHPEWAQHLAITHHLHIRLRAGIGEHVVAGTILGWVWTSVTDPLPKPHEISHALNKAVRVGFERTLEQDFGFGNRQMLDAACKALSPAVNDPYTALQAIDHLSVVFRQMAARPMGARRLGDAQSSLTIPGRTFGDHLVVLCGLLRRYGCKEPSVLRALLRLLTTCLEVIDDPARAQAIHAETELIAQDAEREMGQPVDGARVRALATEVQAAALDRLAHLGHPNEVNRSGVVG